MPTVFHRAHHSRSTDGRPDESASCGNVRGSRTGTQGIPTCVTRRRARSLLAAGLMLPAFFMATPGRCAAGAEFSPAGKRLMDECLREKVNPFLNYRTVDSDPGRYSGSKFLLAGSIQGIVQVGEITTYLVDLADGTRAGVSTTGDPAFGSGNTICALVRVPEVWSPPAALELVDMFQRYDADPVVQQLVHPDPPPAAVRTGPRYRYTRGTIPSRSYESGARSGRLQDLYANAIHWFNPKIDWYSAREIAGLVLRYSEASGVDPRLVMAIIAVESEFDINARSNHGAMGLGQLMPGTAKDLGVSNPYDAEQNVAGAVRLIRWHLAQNSNQQDPLALALACYNAGENAVKRHHGVPPYRETIRYVQKVKQLFAQMSRGDHR